MPYCVKKRVVVEFYDLRETEVDHDGNQLIDGVDKHGKHFIKTLESNKHIVDPDNDYIMKGVKGEKYAIKKEIFRETYDKVLHMSQCGVYRNPKEKCDCVR